MDRVQGNVAVTISIRDANDDKIVDVVKIFADFVFCDSGQAIADHNVTGRADADFASYVTG